jgi:hypothetical protein
VPSLAARNRKSGSAAVGMTREEGWPKFELLLDGENSGSRSWLEGRPAESHICQNRADMGHPAVVAGIERKKRS